MRETIKENIKRGIEARSILPISIDAYHDRLHGMAIDTLSVACDRITERLDNIILPEEINREEAEKFVSYLKTIGFFKLYNEI